MLPQLPRKTETTTEVDTFLIDLQTVGFYGDISTDESSLAVASTDNSIWQISPQAIISPRTHSDVEKVVRLLSKQHHRNISITPRGGGTSTAGQSLTNSIVLDCKRHMHHILDFDQVSNQVHVECGAVLLSVNDELKQFGVMIGPTVATASRATIGGMIGNDSAGKGSIVYGKMSDCVVKLTSVLSGGTSMDERPDIIDSIKNACDAARPYFSKFWPNLPRFVSGYNLPMAWDGVTLDVNRIFCGSEGTLGVTTSAILQCVPIPKNQQLLLLCFESFDSALRYGASLIKHNPTAIEAVDEMVLEAVRKDTSWRTISALLGKAKDDANAILFVECKNAKSILDSQQEHRPLLAKVLIDQEEISLAWSFRSRSVGLLSSLQGKRRPVPFVEDCAVSPNKLAEFIGEFKKLLARHNVKAGMFGHVDAGVIHVRPALDMQCEHDRKKIRTICEQVVSLVHSFGGVLWGEHGKGFRSEFGPVVFGEEIWEQMCNIKSAFDPFNQFNPGKVAVPNRSFPFVTLDKTTRGEYDSKSTVLPVISQATKCDGNSECLSVSHSSSMCPTYRASGDIRQSPRGRADVLRRWLHRLHTSPTAKRASFLQRFIHSKENDDFNHEVKYVLDGCLSCKACSSDCPMQIDISSMRSHFYEMYYGRYLRPMRDLAWLNMERFMPLQRILPRRIVASLLGISDPPKPSYKLKRQITTSTPQTISKEKPDVVLIQDSFTTHFRHDTFLAMLKIINCLGKRVAILPLKPCGKALHIRGALHAFNKLAKKNIQWLMPIHKCNIPIVGIDPAATLLWRDEYLNNQNVEVLLPQEWLITQDLSSIELDGQWRLFPHCIEQSTATQSSEQWKRVFELIGSKLEIIETSCCGMGGLFGHQRENKQRSLDIWELHWNQHFPNECDSLTTGFSCHSQAKRINDISLKHPLEVIANPTLSQQKPMVEVQELV